MPPRALFIRQCVEQQRVSRHRRSALAPSAAQYEMYEIQRNNGSPFTLRMCCLSLDFSLHMP
jgi:hypothetical protein